VSLDSCPESRPKESANHLRSERFVKSTEGGKSIFLMTNVLRTSSASGCEVIRHLTHNNFWKESLSFGKIMFQKVFNGILAL
jgi:hypothetical protein